MPLRDPPRAQPQNMINSYRRLGAHHEEAFTAHDELYSAHSPRWGGVHQIPMTPPATA